MAVKYLDPDKAPAPPPKQGPSRADYFRQLLTDLPDDKVAEVTPEADQSIRGMKVSIGRVASGMGWSVRTWDADGKVYIQKLGTKE